MDWLNANAGAVQGIATVVLVVLNIYYVVSTRSIAAETRDMSTATEQLTELTRQQQVDATLPVIGFRLLHGEQYHNRQPTLWEFRVEIVNVGVGPALDFDVSIANSSLRLLCSEGPSLPMAIAVGESITMEFKLFENAPFLDSAMLKWPRNEEDAAAERKVTPVGMGGERKVISANHAPSVKQRNEEDRVFNRLKQDYRADLSKALRPIAVAGTLRATYRDVHGRCLSSESEIRCREDRSVNSWKILVLAPTTLRGADRLSDVL